MRSECAPLRQSAACRANRSVNIGCVALCDRSQLFTIRRIERVEIFSRCGRLPCPADEDSKAAAVFVQPRFRFFRIFRSGPVFHADEFFSDAHRFTRVCSGHSRPAPLITTSSLSKRVTILRGISSCRVMLQLPLDVPQQSARAEAEQFRPRPR